MIAWVGSKASVGEKKKALQFAQDYVIKAKKHPATPVSRVLEGGSNEVCCLLYNKENNNNNNNKHRFGNLCWSKASDRVETHVSQGMPDPSYWLSKQLNCCISLNASLVAAPLKSALWK